MIVRLRAHYLNALTSFAHLALIMFAFHLQTRRGWIVCLSLIALISFTAWIANFRRSRIMGDTPTSRVASAAQGYVELIGVSEQAPEIPIASKFNQLPCCWYRYEVQRRSDDNKWEHVESGESDELFLLSDSTGKCLIDPEHAEVMTTHKRTWMRDDYRYTEWLLLPNDKLYAIGEFKTIGGAAAELDFAADVKVLLEEWKRDQPKLRFDVNNDKTLDLNEWQLARQAAKREIEKKHREIRSADAIHLLQRPNDKRLFLLSNLDPTNSPVNIRSGPLRISPFSSSQVESHFFSRSDDARGHSVKIRSAHETGASQLISGREVSCHAKRRSIETV